MDRSSVQRQPDSDERPVASFAGGARSDRSYPGGHNEGFPDTFKQLYAKVYDYIFAGDLSKKPDFPTFADGHYEMLLCEAIEQSAREKSWVKVS